MSTWTEGLKVGDEVACDFGLRATVDWHLGKVLRVTATQLRVDFGELGERVFARRYGKLVGSNSSIYRHYLREPTEEICASAADRERRVAAMQAIYGVRSFDELATKTLEAVAAAIKGAKK